MKWNLILVTVLFSGALFAQEEKVIVVKQSDYKRTQKKRASDRNVENYNAFKFDPFRMAIGEINFSWETRIDEKVTLEFEAGPTVSNLGGGRFSINGGTESYQEQSGMGGLISAAVRYYPLEGYWAMNKLYVSPRIKYRRYNSNYHSEDVVVSDQRAYSNETIFSFNIGYQQWFSENFAFDYYIGMGIGTYKGTSYTMSSVYDGNTGLYTNSWDKTTDQYAHFVGVIGMKVTIGN